MRRSYGGGAGLHIKVRSSSLSLSTVGSTPKDSLVPNLTSKSEDDTPDWLRDSLEKEKEDDTVDESYLEEQEADSK